MLYDDSYYIQKLHFQTVAGRPDSLYAIPEFHGGIGGLIVLAQNAALDYTHTHKFDYTNQQKEYEEYF